ncbi:MAG: pentapeptide repeat-containing protein [Pseudomonadota bacterium]
MKLYSIYGQVLFEENCETQRDLVEKSVQQKINLSRANLRKFDLSGANLKGARLSGCHLWGAILDNTNLESADLTEADCRLTQCHAANLSLEDCRDSDFSGAKFDQALFQETDFSGAIFSHPSFWAQKIDQISSLDRAIYNHLGEEEWDLSLLLPKISAAINQSDANEINKIDHQIRKLRKFSFKNGGFKTNFFSRR